ncbi:MAG: hypothetical protein HYU54_00755 [Actinobacteria bacterium]|nr:hypothetical protein [Actinomycetota bacterium]
MGGRHRGIGPALVSGVAIVATAGLFTACAGREPHPSAGGSVETGVREGRYQRHPAAVPMAGAPLPAYAQVTPELQVLYSFALEHPEVLTYMPCTCGCVDGGHHSNWNCYVRAVMADGTVVLDDMAPT